MTGRSLTFACLALLLLASQARAQGRSLDIERFRPAPDADGFLGIPGTRTPGPWAWNVAFWGHYSLEPLTLRRVDDGSRAPIVRHRVGGEFVGQIGISDRVAAVLDVPMVLWQSANANVLDGGSSIAAVAVRDPYVALRARLLGEAADGHGGPHEGEGLALQVATTLPFGLEQSFAGEGGPQLEAAVLGDFHFLLFGVGAIVGYRHRFAEPVILGERIANELYFGAALQSPVFVVPNTVAIFEVRVDTALDREAFAGPTTAVEGDLGVRWAERDVELTWGIGMGWSAGVGTPAVRGLFGINFIPRSHDADGDGLPDTAEPADCVYLPEDFDRHADDDGCPDPDNDGDLVPDEEDRCPNDAAQFGHDADEDGCNDAANDRDGDAVIDGEDSCPELAEDRDERDDDDGCPDLDDDGDGVPDATDRCPTSAEDRDGAADDDGCPDPDDDGDGVGDADDRCRAEPEDRDGTDDGDGCPDLDDDRDGVIDAEDRCAGARETINGIDDGDGCADTGGRALWRSEEGGVLRGTIRWRADGTIDPASAPALDQLARHLIARWDTTSTVAIAVDEPARREAIGAALAQRGVQAGRVSVVHDPSLRGANVRVSGASPAP